MISVQEMTDRLLQQVDDNEIDLDNRSSTNTIDARWERAKKKLCRIPSLISKAMENVEQIKNVSKKITDYREGRVTKFTADIDGYELILDVQYRYDKGYVRAWITLYDNKNGICALRDLKEEDQINEY